MKAAIIGYGKMGHEIERILEARGHEVVLKIDADNSQDLNAENLANVDVAIEFTTPQTAYSNIRTCLEAGVAVVSGTTGWTERLGELQQLCETLNGSFIYSSNYSIGVNIAFRVNRYLASLMNRFPEYGISIDETHHVHKKDAPSGTAISLADDIAERVERKSGWTMDPDGDEENILIRSFREGEVPGIHTVKYESDDDVLTLKHELKGRRALASGAVTAAEFVSARKGVFTIDDLFE